MRADGGSGADGKALGFRWPSTRDAKALTPVRHIDGGVCCATPGSGSRPTAAGEAVAVKKREAVRFARVAVKDTPAASASMYPRLVLANHRHAELGQCEKLPLP